ncbi:MAG: NAD/NADP octopine/nopaline dehydrogenase family protein [Bacteroidales bacterium]|nr:NAD/NADP octopine/nopaline dehydrogenase family protein [Bacteroidales bacterium]
MIKICLVGGGNLTHATLGVLSLSQDLTINLLTRKPNLWNHTIKVNIPDGKSIYGHLNIITSDPSRVIPEADIILLCLPAFAIEETIINIKPYLQKDSIVGTIVSNTGFFIYCHKLLSRNTKLFGFQRVPYVSRIVEYGKETNLLGYRDELFMATENIDNKEEFKNFIAGAFQEKTTLVESFYEVTLSNSNPILHTGRLYTMWKDWNGKPFDKCSLFYREWTDEASELEVKMDEEFFKLLKALNVNTSNIETLLTHYESSSPHEMTEKIKSIKSLETILSPMKQVEGGWVPDIGSRYFTEDFPYGLSFICNTAKQINVSVPHLDMVLDWGLNFAEFCTFN